MTEELKKKVEQAVRLIKSAGADGSTVEVAYSCGKDSDVILELTRMSGIKYRAIYRNTTIDPPGTIKHAIERGAEIVRPEKSFFQLVEQKGYPSRFVRFCCDKLKEYKILDRAIIGVRRAESTARSKRYTESTQCRFYGNKKEYVEAFYPILDWTDEDVVEFIIERGIKLHPLYYREDGSIDPKRRLGCMCCPLLWYKKRIQEFQKTPGMVKAYLRAGEKYRKTHPHTKFATSYPTIEEAFVRFLFYESDKQYRQAQEEGLTPKDNKAFLEKFFGIELK